MKQIYAVIVAGFFTASLLQAQEPPLPPGVVETGGDDADTDRTPPRLSFIDGQVSFWRTGADDWTRAQINLPLAPGDALYAGDRAGVELEVGPRMYVRAGERTQVGLENQEPDFVQFKVTTGSLAIDVRDIEAGHTIEIDTPNAVFAVERAGYYRVDVADTSSTFIARRSGRALITPANGESRTIAQNEQIVVDGVDTPTVESYAAADLDAWDRWNYSRTDHASETRSAQYVPKGVYGTRDLDEYGAWAQTNDYGPVWTPHRVATDWAPYSDGRWVWDASFGWTWVDNAPWGWAPSHYGRWVHVHNHWGWAPGPVIAAPVYAPAVVAFFGNSHVSVSVGISAPSVGWVALGWGEPVVPWWGHREYIGRPSWRGWGGPRVVNRTVINNTTIVNVNNINVYENARVRNAVVAERADRFGRRDAARLTRVRAADVERFQPVRGAVDVRPVSASLSPRRERGLRPSDDVIRRPVVASRAPKNVERSLGAQGINVRNQPVSSPRIVQGTRPAGNRAAQQAEREQAAPQERQLGHQPGAPQSGRRDVRDAAREPNRGNGQEVDRSARQAPVPPGGAAQSDAREPQPANQPGSAASGKRNARNQSREVDRPNPPPVDRSVGQAPASKPAREAQQATQPGGAASGRRDARDQARETNRPNPPSIDGAARQAPNSRAERERSVERQQAPVPPKAEAPSVRDGQPQRADRQPQVAPRAQQEAPRSRPEQARQRPRVEPEQRTSQPAQANRPAPVVRSQPQPKRQQESVVRSRPESAPQQQTRKAPPRQERMSQPQRAERQQQAPAASAPRERSTSAGDAPRKAPAKKNAPGSGQKQNKAD